MKTSRTNATHPFQSRNNNGSRLMRKALMLAAAVFSLLIMSATASVQAGQRFTASLTGPQEVPPNASTGTGYGSVILSDDLTTITVNLGFTGLGFNASDAHIHNAPVGVDGGIIFPLTGTPAATSGIFLQQVFAISPAQVTELLAGNMYFNIHSTGFGGGEIRGQILLGTCSTAGPIEVESSGGTATGVPTAYASLGAAFTAINGGVIHTGVLGIDVCSDTNELAVVATLLAGNDAATADYASITMSPTGGAARTITGAPAGGSPMIDLSGADNVTIDGLNTGGNTLTIANTTVSATTVTSTIRFIGGASNNTITNSNIQGSGTMSVATNGANVFFSTDAVAATGNDNNTISNNNIGPAGANLPTKGILCNGSTAATTGNTGLVINNNNIFDYFGAAVTSAGVAVNGGCKDNSITNNRFYQTATRTETTAALHSGIFLNSATATSGVQGFTVTGNTIGFASNTQTGIYTLTGAVAATFRGISFNGITGGTVSNINSNTVASVSLTGVTSSGTSSSAPMMGIFVLNGVANTNSNTIGSQSATGSITYSSSSVSASDVMGMFNFSFDNWTANTNNIGGITAANTTTGASNVYGIRLNTLSTVTTTISSNTIGGTIANSLQSTSTATGSQVAGVFVSTSIATVSSNTIRNLTAAGGTGTTTAASVVGIDFISTTPVNTASQNTIFNLSNTNATAASIVTGIQFTGATGNVVERNLIHSLTTATNSATAELNGIRVAGGTTIYRNNMIAIGAGTANAIGAAATNAGTTGINGINEALGTDSFFHNSVYIGGSPTAGVGASYAFNGTQTVNTRSFRDNIFFNARSNATGSNYAVKINGTTPNPTGLTINNNVYFANGTGAVFGFFNSLDVANLAAWKTAVGQDAGSFESNPQYLDPTNAVPDLHIHPTNATVIEGNGADVGVTNDFDGQTRASFTPTDIGADAGNFNGVDLSAPNITYTAFGNTSLTTNRVLSVTITDVTGVATGGLAPRIYFNKNLGINFSTACSLSSGTVNSGVWSCTIDNSLVGGVVTTDVIRYFVVAQDTLGNLAANPSGGFTGTNVNAVTTPPTTPNQYTIVTAFTGSYNVGAAETFTSLTNTGGIFEAINAGALTGNVTINITSDLASELGTVALNQWAEDGLGNYSMLIKPSGAPRLITGTNAGALIRLNGADRVRIDGSTAATLAPEVVGGNPALRQLTIQNTNVGTSAVVISIGSGTNGAQNNTIQDVNVLGQDPTTTLLGISLGGTTPGTVGTDNDNNRIENCSVKRALFGIYSAGLSLANQNTGTVITMNETSDVLADRIRRVGIVVFNDNGVQITENSINGVSTNESADAIGIGVGTQGIDTTSTTAGGVTNALVARNKINGVASLSAVGFSAAGITVAGATGGANTIQNNFITGVTAPSTAPDIPAGIYVVGAAGSATRLYHNSIAMTGDRGVVAGQTPSFGVAITGTDPTVELKNNIFYTTQIASGGGVNAKSYAIGMVTTTFVNLDSDFNDFFSSGANAGFFRSGSLGAAAGTDYATVALWGAFAGDFNSQELNPNYINPLNDLHLTGVFGANLLSDGITGFATVDFDNDPRPGPASNPDIGADEIVQSQAGSIPAGTYYNAAGGTGESLGGNVTITNAFYLIGMLSTGANTLTIDCNGTVSGASPTSFVIGNLKKNYCATGVKGFEVGTANGYSPVSVNVTAGTFPADFTVKAVQGPQPNIVNPGSALQRYWTLTATGVTADLTFNYIDADIPPPPSTENSFVIFKYDGSFTMPGGTVSPALNQASISGVSSFSDWTLAQPNAPTAAPASISGRVTTTSGAPLGGVTMYLSGARSARVVSDSNGNYRFLNIDTDNFYTVVPSFANYQFSPASRSFSLLANMTDATFTGTRDAVSSSNVIDTPEYFVRQHYLDFLSREPDDAGLNFWSDQIISCGNDFNCIERRTINVSAAYFLSIEFQETGGLVDRLYRASYDRAPLFDEFMPDAGTIREDLIVGEAGWQELLATNKREFLDAWVERAAFRAAYDNLSNASYVDTLISHTDVSFTDTERAEFVGGLAEGTLTRAQVLQRIAQNERFVRAKFNEAFVRMQYFGYLRRDPDDSGFHFWLNKLNEFEGNFERAEMVKAFLVSGEYRDRFRQ